jgi:hypothetical protein
MTTQAAEGDSNFLDPPTHTLYISARTPNGAQFLRQSPLAILDHYIGDVKAQNAPEWVRCQRSSVVFRYRAASFAKLFIQLATWKVNLDQASYFTMP